MVLDFFRPPERNHPWRQLSPRFNEADGHTPESGARNESCMCSLSETYVNRLPSKDPGVVFLRVRGGAVLLSTRGEVYYGSSPI